MQKRVLFFFLFPLLHICYIVSIVMFWYWILDISSFHCNYLWVCLMFLVSQFCCKSRFLILSGRCLLSIFFSVWKLWLHLCMESVDSLVVPSVVYLVYLCVDSLVVLSVDSSCTFAWRVWLYLVCLYLCVDNLVVLSG